MSYPTQDRRFAVLLPVKRPAVAKSRLRDLGDAVRRDLVVAFAVDTANAALQSALVAAVLAVTDDAALAAGLRQLGAAAVPDGVDGDLNSSLALAAAEAHRRWPDLATAALCADLPALRSEELSLALAATPQDGAGFVADLEGTGTTLLATAQGRVLCPRFGPDSRQEHLRTGAVELDEVDVPTLRLDVDTPADLHAALRLGVGARTALVTTGLRL